MSPRRCARITSAPRGRTAPRRALATFEIVVAFTLLAIVLFLAIFGRLLQSHDPMQGDLMARFTPVGQKGYLMGSDHLGRDLWSRMLAGLQWSMGCALTANTIN